MHHLATYIALFTGMLTSITLTLLPLVLPTSAPREHYLQRAARKYSVSPLNVR